MHSHFEFSKSSTEVIFIFEFVLCKKICCLKMAQVFLPHSKVKAQGGQVICPGPIVKMILDPHPH